MKQIISGLEETKIDALNILVKNPKNKEIEGKINELIGIVDRTIYMLSKVDTEAVVRDAAIKATGEIEITIDKYKFIKNDLGNKRIAIYKIDSDGMSEYIDSIDLCPASDIPQVQKQYRGKDGKEIMNTVLRGQLRSWISEVTKNYSTMEVHLTKKEEVNAKLTEHLNKKAKKYGVTFENVSLAETRASKEVQAAIEKRQQISQEVEQQKLQLEKSEVAKQAAQLEAERKVIQAEGEKKANEIKAQGLDERILKEKSIEKWDGKYPQVIGGNSITSLN